MPIVIEHNPFANFDGGSLDKFTEHQRDRAILDAKRAEADPETGGGGYYDAMRGLLSPGSRNGAGPASPTELPPGLGSVRPPVIPKSEVPGVTAETTYTDEEIAALSLSRNAQERKAGEDLLKAKKLSAQKAQEMAIIGGMVAYDVASGLYGEDDKKVIEERIATGELTPGQYVALRRDLIEKTAETQEKIAAHEAGLQAMEDLMAQSTNPITGRVPAKATKAYLRAKLEGPLSGKEPREHMRDVVLGIFDENPMDESVEVRAQEILADKLLQLRMRKGAEAMQKQELPFGAAVSGPPQEVPAQEQGQAAPTPSTPPMPASSRPEGARPFATLQEAEQSAAVGELAQMIHLGADAAAVEAAAIRLGLDPLDGALEQALGDALAQGPKRPGRPSSPRAKKARDMASRQGIREWPKNK